MTPFFQISGTGCFSPLSGAVVPPRRVHWAPGRQTVFRWQRSVRRLIGGFRVLRRRAPGCERRTIPSLLTKALLPQSPRGHPHQSLECGGHARTRDGVRAHRPGSGDNAREASASPRRLSGASFRRGSLHARGMGFRRPVLPVPTTTVFPLASVIGAGF